MCNILFNIIYYPAYPRLFIATWSRRVSFEQTRPIIVSFVFVLIQFPTISCYMQTKGVNCALWDIVGYVASSRSSVQSRVIAVGVAVAVAVGIAVALIPTTVGISRSSTCCASSVGIGVGANLVYKLAVLIQKFVNLRLLLVYLGLLFPDDLQQIVILSRRLLDVLFVGSFRYRYFVEIGC